MLFRKDVVRSCSYCEYATKLNDGQVLCIKRGVMPMDGACGKFYYDPCKRIPPKMKLLDTAQYQEEDFKL